MSCKSRLLVTQVRRFCICIFCLICLHNNYTIMVFGWRQCQLPKDWGKEGLKWKQKESMTNIKYDYFRQTKGRLSIHFYWHFCVLAHKSEVWFCKLCKDVMHVWILLLDLRICQCLAVFMCLTSYMPCES